MKNTGTLINILRRIGVGKFLLWLRRLPKTLSVWNIKAKFYRARYLPLIAHAKPIPASQGEVEIHMLLNHRRIWEACWALYSFAVMARKSCRIIIHDDGSLTPEDLTLLNRVFPGLRIVTRAESDQATAAYFSEHGLENCARLRRSLFWALKFFDPVMFAENDWFLLMDSDVLYFQVPRELLDGMTGSQVQCLYSKDVARCYCLGEGEMKKLLGVEPIALFNPGVARVRRDVLDYRQVELWLAHPQFWSKKDGKGHNWAELTLWSMVLSLAKARPLPETYAICAPNPEDFVYGHYCGGNYESSLYYTRGIPFLNRRIIAKQHEQ